MLGSLIKDIIHIFYPDICIHCNIHLLEYEKVLCTNCRHDISLINIDDFKSNKISNLFYGFSPINKCVSFLYFEKKGITKNLIHELKYNDNQKIGTFLGNWFGEVLKKSNEFNDIDFIVPVPLHKNKLKKREYNQLTKFGNALSQILETKLEDTTLQKVTTTQTQTFKTRFERFNDNETKFYLSNKSIFKNKHILLIDDVITTGATLEACCKELQKTENITISIATIAFTPKN